MKNAAFGTVGILLFTLVITCLLSVQQIGWRKNEIENNLARIVEKTLEEEYASGKRNAEVEEILKERIRQSIGKNEGLTIDINACDMNLGIISVTVENDFHFPNKKAGKVRIQKTAIVDRAVE